MADSIKAQKLAAARKKLKEFQQRNKAPKPNEKSRDNEKESKNIVDSIASSNRSSPAVSSVSEKELTPVESQTNSIQNYFDNNNFNLNQENPNSFFDYYSSTTLNQNSYDLQGISVNADQNFIQNEILQGVYSNENPQQRQIYNDSKTLEYPDLKPIENLVRHESDMSIASKIEDNDQFEASHQKEEQNTFNNYFKNENYSTQHDLLVEKNYSDFKSNSVEMKRLNDDLSALLENEKHKVQQLQSELDAVKSNHLKEFERNKTQLENYFKSEIEQLQEKLQYHIKTMEILVSEKTELTNALAQKQLIANEKTSECEELQGRLKTSRSRVADLEKELNNIKNENRRTEKLELEKNEEFTSLRKEIATLKEQKEELSQDLSELREKFNGSTKENLRLQHEIQELTAQLSLANIKIQQLSAGGSIQNESKVEELLQQKASLEIQVQSFQETTKKLVNERDQANAQYQQYAEQLNTQLTLLAQKLESTTNQNESLVKREEELVQHIGELEKRLQSLQNEQGNFVPDRNGNGLQKELDNALQVIKELEQGKSVLEKRCGELISENDDLLKDIESKKEAIDDLEAKVERFEGNQPDSAKLLAAMESDKVAAARAVTQNTQLKKQLEDMQEDFIKISNHKLELTEKLTSIEHQNKELIEKVQQFECQLHTLTEAIEIKDRELTLIREGSTELSKQIYQQNQLADRLRHYEAQEQTMLALQNELKNTNKLVEELTKENSYLKEERLKIFHSSNQNSSVSGEINDFSNESTSNYNDGIRSLDENLSVLSESTLSNANRTLSVENDDLKRKVEELAKSNEELLSRLNNLNIVKVNQTDLDKENSANAASALDKEVAMKQLEEKFTKTMEDIANLQDEKQRLEHVVLQLQGETETIGEYIALYQHQRAILKQRAIEKENQLKKLSSDREQMLCKIEQLNSLVRKLLREKGSTSVGFKEQQQLHIPTPDCDRNNHGDHNENVINENLDKSELFVNNDSVGNVETAEKIIALLSEMKTSNLVQPSEITENFHPCPCCSGHLLNI